MKKDVARLAQVNVDFIQRELGPDYEQMRANLNGALHSQEADLTTIVARDRDEADNFDLVRSFVDTLPPALRMSRHEDDERYPARIHCVIGDYSTAFELHTTNVHAAQVLLGGVAWLRESAKKDPLLDPLHPSRAYGTPYYVIGRNEAGIGLLAPAHAPGAPTGPNSHQREFALGRVAFTEPKRSHVRYLDALEDKLRQEVTEAETLALVDPRKRAYVIHPEAPFIPAPLEIGKKKLPSFDRISNEVMADFNVIHYLSRIALLSGKLQDLSKLLADRSGELPVPQQTEKAIEVSNRPGPVWRRLQRTVRRAISG